MIRFYGHFEGDAQTYRTPGRGRGDPRQPGLPDEIRAAGHARPRRSSRADLDGIDREVAALIDPGGGGSAAGAATHRGRPSHRRLRQLLKRGHHGRALDTRRGQPGAFDQEMERDPTVILMGEDIAGGAGGGGEQEAWGRSLRALQGPLQEVRRPRARYAAVGGRVRRRRGSARPTCGMRPGRGVDVHSTSWGVCFRSDLQPGGEVPLHVRRQGGDAGGDSHHVRRRTLRRRPALADVDLDVHPRPRHQGGVPLLAL